MSERELPTREPGAFAAGETPRWTKTLDDFPASEGWELTYYLRGAGAGLDVSATADGDGFLVEVQAASTENLTPGSYRWQGWVSKDDESYQVADAPVVVKRGFAGVAAETVVETRSEVKQILDAIDAMIKGKATRDQQEYTIGDRQLRRLSITDLMAARKVYASLYAQELRRERVRRGGRFIESVNISFKRPR